MTVEEMLHRISSRELTEWMAYARIEPFGNERYAIADLQALTANLHRDPKKRAEPFTADDFLFAPPEPETPELEPEEVSDKVVSVLSALGG